MGSCRALMIQGTASNVGKSIVVTALCRIFSEMGMRVAPFKAQNMALNSFVTEDGKEIGRAQAVQAEAAGIEPCVEMNPILLKPTTDSGSQVIFMGRPVADCTAREYYAMKSRAVEVVRSAYAALSRRFDLIVIEGAGSPAEINLTDQDIVNMSVAEMAGAPVILVADIDRGGVFASLIGTMDLLADVHRSRVRGFLINKFRGDVSLLEPGLRMIRERTGRPVFGVLPYLGDLHIQEEDSVALAGKPRRGRPESRRVRIGAVRLPHISNYTDMDPLEQDPAVDLVYLEDPQGMRGLDAVILPGSKDTIGDLGFLKRSGLAEAVREFAGKGGEVVGLCGGFQMLGEVVEDPQGVENARAAETGLCLLPVRTVLDPDKLTARVRAVSREGGRALTGYEIHMGRTLRRNGCPPMFRITERNGRAADEEDGARSPGGNIWGTYIHGIFENAWLRREFTERLGRGRGIGTADPTDYGERKRRGYAELARVFRAQVDMNRILALAGMGER